MAHDLSPERLQKFAGIAQWIVTAGNQRRSERGLTAGLGSRLLAAGIPVARVSMGSDVLDPIFRSRNYVWTPEKGAEPFSFEHGIRESDAYRNSPFRYLQENQLTFLHTRIDSELGQRFPLLQEFRAAGLVDYYVKAVRFGTDETRGETGIEGIIGAFTTAQPEGFSPEDIAFIDALMPIFALAFRSRLNDRILGRALSTYLGHIPAERVLGGNIRQGDAELLDAVVWMSDLAGFTRMADTLPKESTLEFLNAYAELVAETVAEHGGEVLKFIGDGILAVFPRQNNDTAPASHALAAAIEVQRAQRVLAEKRRELGLPNAEIVIALHRGEVLFGNFGSSRRLDFTALGPVVNEASRLCALSKTLDQTVLVSEEFRSALPANDNRLVSVGRYALRGVAEPRHLFTPDRSTVTL